MIYDLRHAVRTLVKAPGFTSAALVTLALGIGANTVVFSIVNAVLLRPLPFGESTPRIVSLHSTHPTQFPQGWDDAGISYAELEDIRRESRLIEDAAGHFERNFTLYGEEAVRIRGGSVTPNLFDLLNVEPVLGLTFNQEEDALPGFETVVILSHGLWRNRFSGDPSIIGSTILINERELAVVGVMPPRFRFPERSDLWVPYDPGSGTSRSSRVLLGVGRMREGVGLTQLQQELVTIAERLASLYPDTNRDWSIRVLAYRDLVVHSSLRIVTTTLLGAVGFVLLIGCLNLASLLLARGTQRQRELAVRSAFGAGRRRLVGQMLAESLLLGIVGGALGTLLALWGLDTVEASFPEELPYWVRFDIDWRVISFIVGLSLLTGIVFGLIPALRASRLDLIHALGSGRDQAAGRRSFKVQGVLIVGQVALSLALLVGASLMFQSFLNLQGADSGFDESHILTLRLNLSGDAYDPASAKIAFFQELTRRISKLPGVRAAAATTSLPADDGGRAVRIVTAEHPVSDGTEIGVHLIEVTTGFFETLDLALLEGRVFEERDLARNAAPVAIVNRALADRLWQTEGSEGREIGIVSGGSIDWVRVIGVAPDIQYEEFGEDTAQSRLNIYVPYSRTTYRSMVILVHAEGDPARIVEPVRDTLRRFAPAVPSFQYRTMEEVRFITTWEKRFFSHLFNVFAASAVLLACLGIYGLAASHVGRRTHEIGIRLALGARDGDVVRLVLGQGILFAGLGIVLGLPLSLGVSRILESVLFEVAALNPMLYAAAGTLLALSVCLSGYLPARRATRIEPVAALRHE